MHGWDLHVSLSGRHDLARQIYAQVRAAILAGRIGHGHRVPSSRELARSLDISRNTVSAAYDRLLAEGFLATRAGVGTYVAADVSGPTTPRAADSALRPRDIWTALPEPPVLADNSPSYDLRPGIPDASRFPFATWRAMNAEQLRGTAVGTATHIDPAGHSGLRAALARHLGISRGVPADAAHVLVTNGSQQAIDLIARILLAPGDVVAVEDPGYPPPHRLFRSHGARLVGVPVDADGLVVDALPADARLVYVTPSHQWPLGMSMSLPRRLALLDWADRTGAAIVEDDYDSEFRYAGRPIEPLHSLDRTGRVLYVGSLSKVMLPTLRIGFVVAPPTLMSALRKAKHVTDWHSPVPTQAALARFIDDGVLARHVRRMRRVYAERHHRLTSGLYDELGDELAPIPTIAGLHMAAPLTSDRDDVPIVTAAAADGVHLSALSQFAVTGAPLRGLLFGYGAIESDQIGAALGLLRKCFRS